jgi:hypothetical protein
VLAAALSFGVGDLLVPGIFTHLFDGVRNPNRGLQGLFDSITIILSTPCELFSSSSCVLFSEDERGVLYVVLSSGIVAVILNLVLPQEVEPAENDGTAGIADIEEQKHED